MTWKGCVEVLSIGDYRLTDVAPEHKQLLLSWRNSERVRRNMLTDHVITQAEHDKWFLALTRGAGNLAKVLCYGGRPLGFVNFTNIDGKHNRCYWGFYIGETSPPKGSGTMLALLALSFIFEEFQLRKLCSEVLISNTRSINYHKKLGFAEEGRLKKHVRKGNGYVDLVVMALFGQDWPQNKERLLHLWKEIADEASCN